MIASTISSTHLPIFADLEQIDFIINDYDSYLSVDLRNMLDDGLSDIYLLCILDDIVFVV